MMLCTKIKNETMIDCVKIETEDDVTKIYPVGHFSIATKSLFKAASDCAQIVGGTIEKVTDHWAYVACGDWRYLISEE